MIATLLRVLVVTLPFSSATPSWNTIFDGDCAPLRTSPAPEVGVRHLLVQCVDHANNDPSFRNITDVPVPVDESLCLEPKPPSKVACTMRHLRHINDATIFLTAVRTAPQRADTVEHRLDKYHDDEVFLSGPFGSASSIQLNLYLIIGLTMLCIVNLSSVAAAADLDGDEAGWHAVSMKPGIHRDKPIVPRQIKNDNDYDYPHLSFDDFRDKVDALFGENEYE